MVITFILSEGMTNMRKNDNEELAKALETIRKLDEKTSQYKEDNKGTLEQLKKEIEKLQMTYDELEQQVKKIQKEKYKVNEEINQKKQHINNIYDLIHQNNREKDSIIRAYWYPAMELTVKSFDDLPLISNMHGVVFDLKEHKDVVDEALNGPFMLQISDNDITTYPSNHTVRFDGGRAYLNISKKEDGSIHLYSCTALNIHSPDVKVPSYSEPDELFWEKIQTSEAFVEAMTGKKLPERQKHRSKTTNADFLKLFNKKTANKKTTNADFSKIFNKYFGRQ